MGCPYAAVGMQRALDSAIGLPSRSTSALWMLVFLMPADVRSNFMMPLLVTAIRADGLPHPRSPRPGQHIKEHSADSPSAASEPREMCTCYQLQRSVLNENDVDHPMRRQSTATRGPTEAERSRPRPREDRRACGSARHRTPDTASPSSRLLRRLVISHAQSKIPAWCIGPLLDIGMHFLEEVQSTRRISARSPARRIGLGIKLAVPLIRPLREHTTRFQFLRNAAAKCAHLPRSPRNAL